MRFNEPGCSLALAGPVHDRRPSPNHTAALLVHMAASGAVQVKSKPLKVKRITDESLTDPLELELFEQATMQASKIGRERLRKMNRAVEKAQDKLLEDASVFAPGNTARSGRDVAFFVFFVLVAAMFPLAWWFFPGWLGPYGAFIVVAAILGSWLGISRGRRHGALRTLEPNGTALRDQVEGFRLYIATAEANQLEFEAGQDIYRRYLPWAVLFGLTKRWTKVCQEMADAGRIPAPDPSFWLGATSATTIARSMSSFSGGLRSVGMSSSSSGFFSGGGSGGSSGFSGGSFGGGGGGGTSASSW